MYNFIYWTKSKSKNLTRKINKIFLFFEMRAHIDLKANQKKRREENISWALSGQLYRNYAQKGNNTILNFLYKARDGSHS